MSLLFGFIIVFDGSFMACRSIVNCPITDIGDDAFPTTIITLTITGSSLDEVNPNDWIAGSGVVALERLLVMCCLVMSSSQQDHHWQPDADLDRRCAFFAACEPELFVC